MSTPEFVREAIQGLGFQSDELSHLINLMTRQAGPAVVRTSGANRWNWRNGAEIRCWAERPSCAQNLNVFKYFL